MSRPVDDIELIVIHHPAGDVSVESLQYEQSTQGIGYNFFIEDNGKPFDNKVLAVELLPPQIISNGTYGANYQAWNICVEKGDGNFENTPLSMNDDVIKALIQVIAAKCKKWGWRKRHVTNIVGHQYVGMHISPEYYVTACPGRNMIKLIPEIQKKVAGYLLP